MTAPHVPYCIPLLLTTYHLILTPSLLTTYYFLLTPSPKNYILNFRHSLMRCIVVRRVGTSGRRNTFSIMPISLSIALTPAGFPSTKRRLKRSVNL